MVFSDTKNFNFISFHACLHFDHAFDSFIFGYLVHKYNHCEENV